MLTSKLIEKWLTIVINKYVVPHSKLKRAEAFEDKYNAKGAGIILHFSENTAFVLRITDIRTGK